jgi:hypothetical protein
MIMTKEQRRALSARARERTKEEVTAELLAIFPDIPPESNRPDYEAWLKDHWTTARRLYDQRSTLSLGPVWRPDNIQQRRNQQRRQPAQPERIS